MKIKILKNIMLEFSDEGNITLPVYNQTKLKLGDDISPSDAHNILIVTRGRSGSSFLGDLLNSYPGTFYTFEPLYVKDGGIIPNKRPIDIIKQCYKCNPPETDTNGFCAHNFRLWDVLKDGTWADRFRQYQKFFSSSCLLFPVRLIKTIRFSFEDVESLLLDPELGPNFKIIFLFRDPRGVFQSYVSKVNWCHGTQKDGGPGYLNSCNISSVCNQMQSDVLKARNIKERYSGNVTY